MNINNVFETKYLGAADLQNEDGSYKKVTVTIAKIEMEEFENDGRTEQKPVASFKNAKKQWIMNKTNAMSVAELYGPETNDWIGKQVKLVVARVDFSGKRVPAIRVDPPDRSPGTVAFESAPKPTQKSTAERFVEDDLNDPIPF